MTISLNHARREEARVGEMSDTWVLKWDYRGGDTIKNPFLFGGAAGRVELKATTEAEMTSEIDFHLGDNSSAEAVTAASVHDSKSAEAVGADIGKHQAHPLKVFIENGGYLVTADGSADTVFETDSDETMAAFMAAYRRAYLAS